MTPITVRRRGLLWFAYSLNDPIVERWGFTERHAHDRAFHAWERAVIGV